MTRYHKQNSYGHRIQYLCDDGYRLSWVVDRYYSGSRLRFPTGYYRDTDEAGAKRFAKRWELEIPEATASAV